MDKFLSCPRIKLSNSQTLNLDGVESKVLLSDFAQQLRRKNAAAPHLYFTLLYFALLNAAGISTTQILNQNPKSKKEAGFFSKFDPQKLQRLQTQKLSSSHVNSR